MTAFVVVSIKGGLIPLLVQGKGKGRVEGDVRNAARDWVGSLTVV